MNTRLSAMFVSVMSVVTPLVLLVKVHLMLVSSTSGDALRIENSMETFLYTTPSRDELTACTVGGTVGRENMLH